MTEVKKEAKKKSTVKKKSASASKKKTDAHKAEVESLKNEVKELNDRFLRTVAELDNMRKRQARERVQLLETASEGVIKALLPVVDDLERSLKIPDDVEHAQAFRAGVEMIAQKLTALLASHKVVAMESVGQPFDVDRHDAMMQVDAGEGTPPDTVVEEHEKGYLMGDRVIRHAKVLVSR